MKDLEKILVKLNVRLGEFIKAYRSRTEIIHLNASLAHVRAEKHNEIGTGMQELLTEVLNKVPDLGKVESPIPPPEPQ